MSTHRRFLSLVLILSISLSIIGCGESAPGGVTQEPSSEVENNIDDSEKEVPVQDEIENGDETAQIQEETKIKEETSVSESEIEPEEYEPDYSDNSAQETESYGSGNFQDYWMGDDYFDLEGYLHDIGCDDYYGTAISEDYALVRAKEGEKPLMYIALYKGWEIGICQMTYCTVDKHGKSYRIYADTNLEAHIITVNNYGTTTTEGVLQALCLTIDAINADQNNENPFTQLDYGEG